MPERPRLLRSILRVLCIPATLAGGAALAEPGYYVVTAYSDPGEMTIDFRYWTVASRGSALTKWPEVGLGWNVNARWYTEVIASWITASDTPTTLSSWNWQNDVLLTQGSARSTWRSTRWYRHPSTWVMGTHWSSARPSRPTSAARN